MPLLLLLLGGTARPARAFVQQAAGRLPSSLLNGRGRGAASALRPLWANIDSQPFSTPSAAAAAAQAAPTASKPAAGAEESPGVDIAMELPEFRRLGLDQDVIAACEAYGLTAPSAIQKLAVPPALKGDDLAFSAATGSGKTLAFLMPVIQQLRWQEAAGTLRQACRPRALVLVPTRELVSQVLEVTKALGHVAKVASCGLHGGEDFGAQRRRLQGTVDIVVASPGRLLQHYERGHVFFSQVKHVVIDEMDTMLKDGFGPDLKRLLVPIEQKSKRDKVQYLMATATLTPAVKRLMEHEQFPKTRFLHADDAHRSLPTMRHVMLDTKGGDKVQLLLDVCSQSKQKGERVLVFCNTVQSCRAVEHAMREVALPVLCYHGEMRSEERAASLDKFKDEAAGGSNFLVCTDIASRGLDLPLVEHVVMFDFPLNPIEYLHRSGRTARMGAKGKVTSLLTKRDRVLAQAIQTAVAKGLPLDALSSRKRDYESGGKLSGLKNGKLGEAAAGGGGGGGGGGGPSSRGRGPASRSGPSGGGGGSGSGSRGGGGGSGGRFSRFGAGGRGGGGSSSSAGGGRGGGGGGGGGGGRAGGRGGGGAGGGGRGRR